VITKLDPLPPYAPAQVPIRIKVIGENLSPKAQVRLNGALLEQSEVTTATPQEANEEFVKLLILSPKTIAAPQDRVASIAVANPDKQAAEMGECV
jgi:hypothetical protein